MRYADFEELNTPRLTLRKLSNADAKCYYDRITSSEDVVKYMLWQPHASEQEAYTAIERIIARYESGNCYSWGIALADDNSIIGRIDLLRFDEQQSSCSFAYMIGSAYWGLGYGTEALKAVFDFAFQKMEIQCITADHMRENVASGKVMQKVGMRCVGRHNAKYEKNGRYFAADEYQITVEEGISKQRTPND